MHLPTDDGRYFLGKEGESMIPNIVALIHLNSGTVKTDVRFKTIIGGETK